MAFTFLAPNFSQVQLDAYGQERQNNQHALDWVSEETGNLIISQNPNNARKLKIGQMCIDTHRGIRTMTSKRWGAQKERLRSPFGMFLPEQLEALETYAMYMEKMRFRPKDKKTGRSKESAKWRMHPFQQGALITIRALAMLQEDLQTNYNIPYFLAEWLTQENFFIHFIILVQREFRGSTLFS